MPLGMLEFENVLERPMEVESDVSYLLVEFLRGVANQFPCDPSSPSSGVSSIETSLILR